MEQLVFAGVGGELMYDALPRNPSLKLPSPREPQRIPLPPFLHQHTSARRHAWSITSRTCGLNGSTPMKLLWC